MGKDSRFAQIFHHLEVYERTSLVAQHIFELSMSFPKSEMFSLTDQVRRSSRSIGGQIAEAWAKRRYPRHFLIKPTEADAEQMETDHWIGIAASCGYLQEALAKEMSGELNRIGRMLNSMMNKSSEFCDGSNLH